MGAVGDTNVEAKRVVLERIFSNVGVAENEVMIAGDGPVELREGKKDAPFVWVLPAMRSAVMDGTTPNGRGLFEPVRIMWYRISLRFIA